MTFIVASRKRCTPLSFLIDRQIVCAVVVCDIIISSLVYRSIPTASISVPAASGSRNVGAIALSLSQNDRDDTYLVNSPIMHQNQYTPDYDPCSLLLSSPLWIVELRWGWRIALDRLRGCSCWRACWRECRRARDSDSFRHGRVYRQEQVLSNYNHSVLWQAVDHQYFIDRCTGLCSQHSDRIAGLDSVTHPAYRHGRRTSSRRRCDDWRLG